MGSADIVASHDAYEETLTWLEVKCGLDLDTLAPLDAATLILLARIARATEGIFRVQRPITEQENGAMPDNRTGNGCNG